MQSRFAASLASFFAPIVTRLVFSPILTKHRELKRPSPFGNGYQQAGLSRIAKSFGHAGFWFYRISFRIHGRRSHR